MTKKILAIILAVVIVVMMLPVANVFAAENATITFKVSQPNENGISKVLVFTDCKLHAFQISATLENAKAVNGPNGGTPTLNFAKITAYDEIDGNLITGSAVNAYGDNKENVAFAFGGTHVTDEYDFITTDLQMVEFYVEIQPGKEMKIVPTAGSNNQGDYIDVGGENLSYGLNFVVEKAPPIVKTETELKEAVESGKKDIEVDGMITLSETLQIESDVNIKGLEENSGFDGADKVALVNITGGNNVKFENLTFKNSFGGAVSSEVQSSKIYVNHCDFVNNNNEKGSIVNTVGEVELGGSGFLNNKSKNATLNAGKLTLNGNTSLKNNSVDGKFVSSLNDAFTSADPETTYPNISIVAIGDANVDGAININDAVETLKDIVDLPTIDKYNETNADVDVNTEININDVVETLKYIVNLPSVIVA